MKIRAWGVAWAAILALAGCSTVSDVYERVAGPRPKVAPLPDFQPLAAARVIWQGQVGVAGRYVFVPAVAGDGVWAAGEAGQIVRFELGGGQSNRRIEAQQRLSAGVGADRERVVVGTPKGEVLAFDAGGALKWKTAVSSEVLSPPQIAEGIVVVRSGDGRIFGLNAADGKRKWVYQRPSSPALTIRSVAGVVLDRGGVFAGFPGGKLVALDLQSGLIGWEATVALPKGATELERVTDVVGLPVVRDTEVCAVAYQGRVACFDPRSGAQQWSRDISSTAGLVGAGGHLYVTDDRDAVLALDWRSGASVWKQTQLAGRQLTAPAVAGDYLAVADGQGFVHFLRREDGAFAARVPTDGSPVTAPPQPIEGGVLVQTRNGTLAALAVR